MTSPQDSTKVCVCVYLSVYLSFFLSFVLSFYAVRGRRCLSTHTYTYMYIDIHMYTHTHTRSTFPQSALNAPEPNAAALNPKPPKP